MHSGEARLSHQARSPEPPLEAVWKLIDRGLGSANEVLYVGDHPRASDPILTRPDPSEMESPTPEDATPPDLPRLRLATLAVAHAPKAVTGVHLTGSPFWFPTSPGFPVAGLLLVRSLS